MEKHSDTTPPRFGGSAHAPPGSVDLTFTPPPPNRAARRECKRQGHLWKTDGAGTEYCGRCREPAP